MKNYELSLQWRNSDGTDSYVDKAQPQNQNLNSTHDRSVEYD
ncbi:MAG: hypothetical protein ACM3JQ_05930 [Candidatus Eiseniibacteriota bacterium]|jgi:hypothetical protein